MTPYPHTHTHRLREHTAAFGWIETVFFNSSFVDALRPIWVLLLVLFGSTSGHISVHEFRDSPARNAVDSKFAHSFVNFRLPFPTDVEDGGLLNVDLNAPATVGCDRDKSVYAIHVRLTCNMFSSKLEYAY